MPMNRRHNPSSRRGYTEEDRNRIKPLENRDTSPDPEVGGEPPLVRSVNMPKKQKPDYRNSDSYQDDLYNRAAYTSRMHGDLTPDVDPGHRVAADNTDVVNARNKNAPIPKNEVRLTNDPGGVFDQERSALPRNPGRLSKELDKLPRKKK